MEQIIVFIILVVFLGYTICEVYKLRKQIDDTKCKILKYRETLISETERFIEKSKSSNASPQGSHFDRGWANGFISARSKLEELFDYWD